MPIKALFYKMIIDSVIQTAKEIIQARMGEQVDVKRTASVGGGCINDAHRLDTNLGSFFVKYNHAARYPGMFEAEAKGLALMASEPVEGSPKPLDVPRVVGHNEAGGYGMLVLEYIESGTQRSDFWEAFGSGLARLHQRKPESGMFGLDHDNYIGSLTQRNREYDNWIDFFVSQRLDPQIKLARDEGKAAPDLTNMFARLYNHLGDFFPEEPPALLHGDLWSGNYMTGNQGQAVILDPAVYYGHRYMDLGMSQLFGGFNPTFYRAYQETYPMERTWQKSMDIANLYPLMVHVNLFGGGYLGSVKSILKRFG